MSEIKAGSVFNVPYPFFRDVVHLYDGEGGYEQAETWIPGTRGECRPPDGNAVGVYDGIGQMIITIIDTFKPGPYPLRVFYTRAFKTPDGETFGKRGLRIKSLHGFKSLIGGYRYWDESEPSPSMEAA